jgi:tRNA threonylcarbamoyladenosine biosynthesis protein TsaB
VGSGFASYSARLPVTMLSQLKCVDSNALPRAQALLQIAVREFNSGAAQVAEFVQPSYLRDKVALTIKEREIK